MEVDGVHEQRPREVGERAIAHEIVDQEVERLPAVDRGREKAPERHVDVGHLEDVPPPDQPGARRHLGRAHSGGPGCRDERSHARPDDEPGHETPLLEGAEDPDVREALEAAAAENESEGMCAHLHDPRDEWPDDFVHVIVRQVPCA
jgi:hypothetical protein